MQSEKIISEDKLIDLIRDLKKKGKKTVTTNGTFDILHLAHINILNKAKSLGDILIVLVNSDSSVKMNKGPKRPIVPENERASMLAALECVDYVLIFNDERVGEVLLRLKPSIHFKGGTFIQERIQEEKRVMESIGGEFIFSGEIKGYSTTNIIEKVLEAYKE